MNYKRFVCSSRNRGINESFDNNLTDLFAPKTSMSILAKRER